MNFTVFCFFNPSGKAERTREIVLDGMKKVQDAFGEHDLIANVRLETYEGERYFHVPPSTPSSADLAGRRDRSSCARTSGGNHLLLLWRISPLLLV